MWQSSADMCPSTMHTRQYTYVLQVAGSLPEQEPLLSVLEAGIHYAVQPAHGQKTGFYAGEPPQCADAWRGGLCCKRCSLHGQWHK